MKLLHLDSSALGEASASRSLTADIVAQFRHNLPDVDVIYRDLASDPPAHLTPAALGAQGPDAVTEALLAELFAADVLVIGAPMYNFSIPTPLKAWIDRVAQAGKTFRYTAAGPEGLLKGKQVVIASTRGGVHSQPGAGLDFQESYLIAVLGFLGMTDVRVVRAEGLAMGPEARTQALAQARRASAELFLRKAA